MGVNRLFLTWEVPPVRVAAGCEGIVGEDKVMHGNTASCEG